MKGRVVTLAVLALALLSACSKRSEVRSNDAGVDAAPSAVEDDAVLTQRAEDGRRASGVPALARTSREAASRRRSARALARIADKTSAELLAAHLVDEDDEVVAWAAYGLGWACRGREELHVKMLAARATSLAAEPLPSRSSARGSGEIDARTAVGRAIGRCGGPLAEQVLVSLAKVGPLRLPALLGLGDLASRRKQVGAEAMTLILEVAGAAGRPAEVSDGGLDARGSAGDGDAAGREGIERAAALYALSRVDPGSAFAKRAVDVATSVLGRPGAGRLFAVKVLARAGRDHAREAATELAKVVESRDFGPAERAEAARGLGGLGDAGSAAAASALSRVAPDLGGAAVVQELVSDEHPILLALIASLGAEPPERSNTLLYALAGAKPPAPPGPGLARRLTELRCAAALALARGASDSDVLRKCDEAGGEIGERARLASLVKRPLTGERRVAFRALAKSAHLRVREAAVEAVSAHPELGEMAASVLAEALTSKKPGLVATAAEVIDAHPDRAMVLAASEKRAALDPSAPPPTSEPAKELSRDVEKALSAALAEAWPEDRFETRIALMTAAAAVKHPRAKEVLTAACGDAHAVVRERALKALRGLGEAASCDAPRGEPTLAAEIGKTLTSPVKLTMTTDAGQELVVVLEPELSPITATRVASLARSGFYDGVVVHRVVPGFVAQLGDPDGDGYGGSGTPLRCETSPVRFGALDVGMALAGRDTGSSQIFVTLAETPHLDGEYTRVGRAEGDWWAVAQGDVVTHVAVDEAGAR